MTPATSLEVYTPEKQREVAALLGLKGAPNQISLLFQLAEHYDLDPLTKEIALIPGKGPFIGVWGRLHIAHRSGKLDGLEMDDEWDTDKHHCVRVIVWRKDMGRPAAKVIGRVGKHEGKDWPLEIARARGLRAGLGYAFSIHDSYDSQDDDGDGDGGSWMPPPDERVTADNVAQHVDAATGEIIDVGQTGPEPVPFDDDSEPATVVVGGHTLAQRIAIAARDADIDDDTTRHDIIQAATKGAYQRGSDIPDTDQDMIDRVFDAFHGIADGTVEFRYAPDGTPRLYRIRRP